MKMKTLIGLMLLFSLTHLTVGQDEVCRGPLSDTAFEDLFGVLAYYSRYSYPTYKLNEDCIRSSCPKLKDACPLTSTGNVNQPALSTAVSILNTCIGQNVVCGINMSHIPMVEMGWTTKNLLPANVVNGTIWVIPGSGYLDNLSDVQFTVPLDTNASCPFNLSILAPNAVNTAYHNCSFSILTSLGKFLPSFASEINTPNMKGVYHLSINATVSIDLCTQPPTINNLVNQSDININFTNFSNPLGLAVPDVLVSQFITAVNDYLKKSVMISSATTLLATYVALGLQAVQQICAQ